MIEKEYGDKQFIEPAKAFIKTVEAKFEERSNAQRTTAGWKHPDNRND
jgi:hypothetical protein